MKKDYRQHTDADKSTNKSNLVKYNVASAISSIDKLTCMVSLLSVDVCLMKVHDSRGSQHYSTQRWTGIDHHGGTARQGITDLMAVWTDWSSTVRLSCPV